MRTDVEKIIKRRENIMNGYEVKERKLIHKGSIIEYYKDTMKLPNGNEAHWDFVKHKGASSVIPIDEDGKIIVVRQYRHAIDKYTIEIPAGGMEIGEDPKQAALRELEEETGYKADDATHLIDIYTTIAFCNEKIHIYVAKDLKKTEQNLDEDEFVVIERYTLEDLVAKILDGTIEDSKTISAILALNNRKDLLK